MVRSLEERERSWQRQFAEVEGCYYQMKSRYLMVLNHFKSPEKPSIMMEPGMLQQLMAEVCRTSRDSMDKTDALGFYLKGRTEEVKIFDSETERCQKWGSSSGDLLDLAAEYADKGAQSLEAANLVRFSEQSKENMHWLQSWDAFIVNWVGRPLVESVELKNLVRTGIPEAYRARVWKGLIQMTLKEKLTEFGNGYYSSMLRKTLYQQESGVYDTSIKQLFFLYDGYLIQIDLDLVRTLPANRMFADPDSEKVKQLRRVLYAYRNHDTLIGYCQVLRDLVNEKLPRLAAHLRQFEVDLSLFALSWFLTCCVDVLPHQIYLPIFDVFLYEGNKSLFRFALAILKLCEPAVMQSKTVSTVHAVLSKPRQYVTDYKSLAQVAFNDMNPFPLKQIETKRALYLTQLQASFLFQHDILLSYPYPYAFNAMTKAMIFFKLQMHVLYVPFF
ncbi:unnamed protein product [Strongylus vulgaris]|uniref:Rab-GAP TBC domain-containing protein n=1 Tax=Strongylus vulgaris TaxID=40348 RepID=A0A3P7JNK5_STRVU|nr:unnamed protein product [Strongylus vulgaris]